MISVLTNWEDIDDYPAADDVSIMQDGSLIVKEPKDEQFKDGKPIAIYAAGAWQRIEYEDGMAFMSFLGEHDLVEEWENRREEPVE